MKKNLLKISAVFVLFFLASGCAEWTDIEPKGTNMLQKVSDIDMLFNYRFYGMPYTSERAGCAIVGDLYPGMITGYKLINEPSYRPLLSAYFTWDEEIDRKGATETDDTYTELYGVIGKICNPALLRLDGAEGDRATADRLKAEAYVLRAWFHYLLVNYYAKAYDPATAAEDGGIPYSRETDLLSSPNPQYSVQEVYDFILADLEAAFALNSLGAPTQNRMRVNSAFAHAVHAKVLMSLRDYDGAAQAAAASLAIENTVDDYNTMVHYVAQHTFNYETYTYEPGYSFSRPNMSSSEDLFYTEYAYLLFLAMTPELSDSFEPGSIFNRHCDKYNDLGLMYFGAKVDVLFDQDVYYGPGGLSTVDMYLTQAECLIRKGDATSIANAMNIINNIRQKRIAHADTYAAAGGGTKDEIDPADYYVPLSAAGQAEAIAYLKRLDRNENWYGPKRFINVKRWNTDDKWKETLSRHVECLNETDGTPLGSYDFTISPESAIWIFPFPSKSIGLNSNLNHNY